MDNSPDVTQKEECLAQLFSAVLIVLTERTVATQPNISRKRLELLVYNIHYSERSSTLLLEGTGTAHLYTSYSPLLLRERIMACTLPRISRIEDCCYQLYITHKED
jgi:hypothetical protein